MTEQEEPNRRYHPVEHVHECHYGLGGCPEGPYIWCGPFKGNLNPVQMKLVDDWLRAKTAWYADRSNRKLHDKFKELDRKIDALPKGLRFCTEEAGSESVKIGAVSTMCNACHH